MVYKLKQEKAKRTYENRFEIAKKREEQELASVKPSRNMKKSFELLKQNFESSPFETPQFRTFYNQFRRDFTKLLKGKIKRIEFHKGHFEISGFFELNDGRIYYFNVGDVRWNKNDMLVRTAKDFEDYTGGSNNFVKMNDNFKKNFFNTIKIQ